MRVMVIGGAGYIGSHVVREMLDTGHSVIVYDNLYSGLRENLFAGTEFIHGSIMDQRHLVHALQSTGAEAVVHLAAYKAAGESMVEPEKYAINNISGTINIANAMTEAGVRYIVFSSSAAVYGEPSYLPIDEKHPTTPENFYGFTKLEIERILDWYGNLRALRSARLRYFNAAGYDPDGRVRGLEQNPANLLPIIMEVAVGMREQLDVYGDDYDTRDGTCIRDYVHVSDLALAHVRSLEYISGQDESIAVNLGSERGITVLEMLETARRVTGRPIPSRIAARRPGDPAELVASSALARELLGWTAQRSDPETLVGTTFQAYTR